MALARLCSSEPSADFLPQVLGGQRETMLALLARAATLGARHAMAALAALVIEGSSSTEELRLAAEHLEAFAEHLLEEERAKEKERQEDSESEEEEEDEEEEEVDQEHNCLHRRSCV